MGRELRKVPPNWQHPTNQHGNLQPMFDENIADARAEWEGERKRVAAGKWHDYEKSLYSGSHKNRVREWLADNPEPDADYYRPWRDSEATWFQVWETVSEGTPVTPPFATKEELVDYLVEHGDFWQQKRWRDGNHFMQPEKPGYSREAAQAFVDDGWAPSMVVSSGRMAMGIDAATLMKAKP